MRNLTSRDSQSPHPIYTGSVARPALARRSPGGHGAWLAAGLLIVASAGLVAPRAWAQQSPATNPGHDAPSPADLEPGVNTSATPPADTSTSTAPAPEIKSKPAVGGKPAAVQSKADTPPAEVKPAGDTRVAASSSKAAPTGGKGSGKAEDHLQLDTTQITGNQELPKVLYIVPWKRSDLGDLLGKPANSLIDEVLQPVDRDVFRRENRYYDAVKPDANANAGGGAGQTSAGKH